MKLNIRLASGILAVALLILPCGSFCESAGTTMYFNGEGYCSGEILYRSDGLIWSGNYETGTAMPLCSVKGCSHTPVEELLYDQDVLTVMADKSICYAARLAAINADGPVLHHDIVYFVSYEQDPVNKSNHVNVFQSEIDGETVLFASLDDWFPSGYQVVCETYYLQGDNMFLRCHMIDNDLSGSSQARDEIASILCVSLTTGKITELFRVSSQYADISLLGIVNDTLFFTVENANDFTPLEKSDSFMAWRTEFEDHSYYSIQGISLQTEETVVVDSRLCNMKLAYGIPFEIVHDDELDVIILPQTPEQDKAVYASYSLKTDSLLYEYEFLYDRFIKDYPYMVLSDEIVLSFNFEEGTFSLRNLKTGEITPLTIPGNCLYGNDGKEDWYDIATVYHQTSPIILTHYNWKYSDSTKAYITAEELLSGDALPHDFTVK